MNKTNKGIGGHQLPRMKTDEWLTPPEIIKSLGEFDLDPCSPINRPWRTAKNHYTKIDDGLSKEWFGRVWLNPPYNRLIEHWMQKMADHQNGIALIFARTETKFFQHHVFNSASSILFLEGRIYFYNNLGIKASFNSGAPSVLISYGKQNAEYLRNCNLKGKYFLINKS